MNNNTLPSYKLSKHTDGAVFLVLVYIINVPCTRSSAVLLCDGSLAYSRVIHTILELLYSISAGTSNLDTLICLLSVPGINLEVKFSS